MRVTADPTQTELRADDETGEGKATALAHYAAVS
jgi:hypothetical protein